MRIAILLGFAVFCGVPLLWLLLAPTKTDSQIVNGQPLSFGSFSHIALAWHHLTNFDNGVIYTWILNSFIYSLGSLVLTLATSLLAGYALAMTQFPGRKVVLYLTLVAMVMPAAALVLPLFLEMNAVGLIDSKASVILPAAFYPFGVYLAFVYFSTSLPKDVLEAARIDGCSEVRVFLLIGLPLARPLISLIGFFSFVANWNNYFLPYVMLSSEKNYNLPVGLGALLSSTPALHPERGGSTIPITRPEIALAGVLVIFPIVILFLYFQRFLTSGILAGSSKS